MDKEQDRQLTELARELRDREIAPERDLWPGISSAIDGRQQQRRPSWWRRAETLPLAAVVAGLLLIAGFRLLSGDAAPRKQASFPTEAGTPVARYIPGTGTGEPGEESTLVAVNAALAELTAAAADDPGNAKLARLVNMVHRSRGNVMRQQAAGWL